jgi:HNH endonuclease
MSTGRKQRVGPGARNTFENADEFSSHLQKLHELRGKRTGHRPKALSLKERRDVLAKTDGRCHICGDVIKANEPWEADHVFAHILGGADTVNNYLPAHPLCNNYRWFYSAEEFQWILKLGVWFRTKIEKRDTGAVKLAEGFVCYEIKRDSRRKR